MKTLRYPIIVFLLATIFFPSDMILAQNQTQPEIEFDHASYSTKSMGCNFYHTGKISTSNQEYDKVTVIVNDSSANKFSTSIDRITVFVWSDSDKKGIEITAYETRVNSGIFEGNFTISDGQSTQNVIHVSSGDTLFARYSGMSSFPLGATNSGITTTSFIGMSCPPFERVPASSLRILDTKGKESNATTVGNQVLITSDIENPTGENQNFTYIVQIQDQNGSTASLAWLSGTMLPNQTSSPSISWTPSKTGNYVIAIFVWQSLTNPNALSAPLSADLTVLHDFTNSRSSILDAKNLHCQLGFELMVKPINGSPVCVTLGTAQKLVQRGWVYSKSLPDVRHVASNVTHESSLHVTNTTIPVTTKFEVRNNGGPQTVDYDSMSGTYRFVETDYFSGNVGQIKTGFPVQANISDPYDMFIHKIVVSSDGITHDGSFNFTCTFHGKFGQDVYTLNFMYGNQTYVLEYAPISPLQR